VRALQHRGRLRAEEVRYAVDLIAHHRGLREQVVAVDPPGPGIGARRISQHRQPVRQVPVRINASSAVAASLALWAGAGIPTSNCCAVGALDSTRSAATAANRAETT
jgi:hypothetical protein